MAQNLAQLTDMWMVNPTMFDPTQASNQFSNYNNAALPWPPSYNTGPAGGPVNAATGRPIQSFQDWMQQNPGGMSINSTPAQPAAQPQAQSPLQPVNVPQGLSQPAMGAPSVQGGLQAWGAATPAQRVAAMPQAVYGTAGGNADKGSFGGLGPIGFTQAPGGGGQAPQAGGGQQASGGAPNNWQAALNSLANPGNPTTMGANVPQVTGYQPSGGVNQAFLQQAGAGQGMNQNFLAALRGIQGRPQ